jgi:hypothetical protein
VTPNANAHPRESSRRPTVSVSRAGYPTANQGASEMLRRSSGREVPASTTRSDRRRPTSGQALCQDLRRGVPAHFAGPARRFRHALCPVDSGTRPQAPGTARGLPSRREAQRLRRLSSGSRGALASAWTAWRTPRAALAGREGEKRDHRETPRVSEGRTKNSEYGTLCVGGFVRPSRRPHRKPLSRRFSSRPRRAREREPGLRPNGPRPWLEKGQGHARRWTDRASLAKNQPRTPRRAPLEPGSLEPRA